MDPCFLQAAEIPVSPGTLPILTFQPGSHASLMKAPWNVGLWSQSRSLELGIQQSQAFHSLPAPFLFLPPVSWGGRGARDSWSHSSGTLPHSLRSALFSRCVHSDAVLFPVALSWLVAPIKFSNCNQCKEEASVSPLTPPSLMSSRYIFVCTFYIKYLGAHLSSLSCRNIYKHDIK